MRHGTQPEATGRVQSDPKKEEFEGIWYIFQWLFSQIWIVFGAFLGMLWEFTFFWWRDSRHKIRKKNTRTKRFRVADRSSSTWRPPSRWSQKHGPSGLARPCWVEVMRFLRRIVAFVCWCHPFLWNKIVIHSSILATSALQHHVDRPRNTKQTKKIQKVFC